MIQQRPRTITAPHAGCQRFCKLRENLHVLETYKKRAGPSDGNHSLSGEDG
jgi:hypothetical protein